ncbi:MAG: hypothetical protein ONB44_18985 [candidate division KSB1 bacterium]|nr:hypothetical protein [candidate division KSB1 bacterium]MDZ7304217.1 hypothetical protein [candidate division KSB1 bacterium]MDZ7311692.1 hypothetical protein [candidate division KSB1 bacterium]
MRSIILKKLFVAALVLAHVAFISCEKNPAESEKNNPPKLPPQTSMAVDLSLFSSSQGLAKIGQEQMAGANFTNAALRVLVINTTVVAGMSVPVIVWAAAASQQPVLGADGKFHWIYTVQSGAQIFQADLAGWIDVPARQSVWEMYITSTTHVPALAKFLWYSGRANLDATSGYWEFFDDKTPATNTKVLRIDWQSTAPDKATLTFLVVKPGVPENGDQLTYRVDGVLRQITLFDKSANTTLDIGWNAQTGAGYLLAPDYHNGQKACWDENRNDVVCTG